MGYRNITWACPFFTWDEKLAIHCEAGVVRCPDGRAVNEYTDRNCASVEGWEKCTLADMLLQFYERQEDPQPRKNARIQGETRGES